MVNYQKLYTTLFNAVTDALEQLNEMNFGKAKEILICGQMTAEEQYISGEDDTIGERERQTPLP